MSDHPIQVTEYCDEKYSDKWKTFLENKGFSVILKSTTTERNRKVKVLYAVFRNLSPQEISDVAAGKYKVDGNGLIHQKQDVKTYKNMSVVRLTCLKCRKPYKRINAVNKDGLCGACRSTAKKQTASEVFQ